MSKYLPTIIAIVTAAAVAATPAIQTVLAAHPTVSVIVAALYAILTHWLPSPVTPPTPPVA